MTHTCPDCGAPVSERAAVCPQCGFPIRRNAIPQGGGPGAPAAGGGGNRTAVLVLALVAGGFFVVVVLGVVAALAIPQFSKAVNRAKELEGEALLKQAYTLQQEYRSEHDVYARSLSELEPLGWQAQRTVYYDVEVSAASDRDLCLEAVPKRSAGRDVPPLSMDAEGRIYHDAGCTGAPAPGLTYDDPSTDRGEQARGLLEQGYRGMAGYRAAHGGELPATLGDLGTGLAADAAAADYRLEYFRNAEGRTCLAARPLSTVEGPERSVDDGGALYIGSACMGKAVELFHEAPATSSGDTAI
ncbi:MAG TPA: zinc ribbon domain-containing protein [Longimicrobium sp.]